MPLDPAPSIAQPWRRTRWRALAAFVVLAGAASLALFLASCGSRGPLDEPAFVDAAPEDAALADEVVPPAPPDSTPDASVGIIACGQCLFGTCGPTLQACFESEPCRAVFQCVTTDCIRDAGGSPSQSCLLGCAGHDPQGALQVLALFQCVTGECGPNCGDLLSGGGFPGLGGGRRRDGG